MATIYHIATKEDLAKASVNGFYDVESLYSEGFIHCSTREELLNTANRRFKDKDNLTLLELDESKIAAKVIHENTSNGTILYPHIYGKLNCNAILASFTFMKNANGEFVFPEAKDAFDLFHAEKHFLNLALKLFTEYKVQGEKAMAQLNEAQLFYQANSESNSIAIIVQHLSGNMISRWTDFLTSDGEKKNRDRDGEFELHVKTLEELMEIWEKGWDVFLDSINSLSEHDLMCLVYIRGEAHSVMKAITRQISHYAFHIGQIVYLAKEMKGEQWKTLSIARGKSKEFKP